MTDETPVTGTAVSTPAPPPAPKAELVAGEKVAPIIPRTIDEVARCAKAVIVAGLAPDSYRGRDDAETASRVMIGIMSGAEVGFGPMTALKNIAIINNRPCIWGDGGVALIHASGKVERWEERFTGDFLTDNWTCHVAIWRKGHESPYEGEFSYATAKRAKLTGKRPWVENPERMMGWRARTYAMRLGFADCLCGLAIAEEVQDLPPPAPPPADLSVLTDDDGESAEVIPGPGATREAEQVA